MNARQHLSEGPGYQVLPVRLSTPLCTEELERLASSFGSLSRRDGGVAVWPVTPRKPEGTFSETASEARFHTDSQYHASPEPFFLLACDRPAQDGGESLFLTRDDVTKIAREALGAGGVRRLQKPVWSWVIPKVFQVPNFPKVSPPAPVLAKNWTIRWRIDNLVTQSAYDKALAHALADALDTSTRRAVLKLEAGEVLLCDNWRVLHARTHFTDPNRRLYRIRLTR